MRALILGGTGFVGRALCREAVRRGWTVTSLSRKGAPTDTSRDGLLSRVEWKSGDALDSAVYDSLLDSHPDYIIHSIGILLESNPLYNLYKSQPVAYNASYRALIRDTTEVAIGAVERNKVSLKGFGYVSATRYGALGTTLLPQYLAMKGEAEELLLAKNNAFRTVIARPGFMYGADRWATFPLSLGAAVMTLFTAGLFPKSLCVDTVARALLNELARSDIPAESKILEASDLSDVARQ